MERLRRYIWLKLWKLQNRGKQILFSGTILPKRKDLESLVTNCLAPLTGRVCQKIATKNKPRSCPPAKAGILYASSGMKGVASLHPKLSRL
jgi:hypothetical protein